MPLWRMDDEDSAFPRHTGPRDTGTPEALRADLTVFFGPRGGAYLQFYEHKRRRQRAGRRGLALSWSWPVFGCWFAWFWYRKLSGCGLAALAVPAVGEWLAPGLGGLLGMVAVAALAKDCYLHAAFAALREADGLGLAGEARQAFLRRRGGVSLPAGTLGAILVLALGALSAMQQVPEILAQLEAVGLLSGR